MSVDVYVNGQVAFDAESLTEWIEKNRAAVYQGEPKTCDCITLELTVEELQKRVAMLEEFADYMRREAINRFSDHLK